MITLSQYSEIIKQKHIMPYPFQELINSDIPNHAFEQIQKIKMHSTH